MPSSPVPRFAFADFASTVLACLSRRLLLTPRLGGGLARFLMTFMRPCPPCSQPSLCTCSPALCRAFSYDWLSCCGCLGSAPSGCCMLEVEGFVEVNDPIVVLFDVLAVLDAFCALLTAAAILCFSMLGNENLDFPGTSFSTGSSGFPGLHEVPASFERSFSRVLGTSGSGPCFCQDWSAARHLVPHCL